MQFLLILNEWVHPPTHTSSTSVNGIEYCYNYYYPSADAFSQVVDIGMRVANMSCVTTLLLSTYQLVGIQFNIRLYDSYVTYALVAQVSSTRFRDVSINVKPLDLTEQTFKDFAFALAVHGQMLMVTDSSIRFDAPGLLLASTAPGLVSFLLNYTSLVSYANLEQLLDNVEGGFFNQVMCSFNQKNGDQKAYLAKFSIFSGEGDQSYTASSCNLGQKFDKETRTCYSEVVSGMDCKECALGYIRGRENKGMGSTVDETKGCFERAGTSNPDEYDCYYSDAAGSGMTKCCLTRKSE